MRLLPILPLLFAALPAFATTVTVHNRSAAPITLAAERAPNGYDESLRVVMERAW